MHKLQSSFRRAPRADRVGEVDERRPIRLTVVLRPGTPIEIRRSGGQALSHAEFRARYASRQAAVTAVEELARQHGLRVVEAEAGKHVVRLEGMFGQARAAFQPEELGVYRIEGREVVARGGCLHLPPELADDVVAVLGFDERPVARPHFRIRPASAHAQSWTPTQVAQHYGFPSGVDGAGQTIALIELGGGYDATQMAQYFSTIGVQRTGSLTSVPVDGTGNAPDGNPDGADGEVQLDIEVAGSVAPGANLVLYFGPNQGSGFLDALQAAVHDESNSPSVISISWGGPESSYAAQDMTAMDQVLQSAAALGITVCVASGDSGATDGATDGQLHVDFPASSPHALGCGGTRLPQHGAEVAWNDGQDGGASGGGYSSVFARPTWQIGVSNAQRGVPDVAGDADPETGYQVSVDGTSTVVGGTSAVAPLWAALVALINQSTGKRAGLINPALYQNPSAFNDITQGNNDGYQAGPGWDPVTGLGSPQGAAVLAALGGTAATS